jgi:hypothetical protein
MDDILSQIIAYAPDRIDTELKVRALVQGSRNMDQEPRNMYNQGSSVDHAVRSVDPERDSFKKISNVLGAYRRYRRGEKNPALNFNQFFELYSTENFAEGGRTGFDKGGPLTGDKFKEIVTKYPDKTNQELLNYFNKNKFTNRYGEPLNLNVITTNKSKFFDIAAETKSQTPKGYISSTEVFENLPISKKDYFRVKQAKEGGTLLTKEIDKLLKPVKIGDTFYFKKPGKNDSRSFSRLADKTGRLNNRIADLMLDFDTAYGKQFFSKGNVPDIDAVAKKFNITDSTAGKVTTRLAQWYGGQDFKNPQLKDLKRNKVTSNRLFKTLEKSGFGNPYRDGLYQIQLQTIDAKLGNKQGTFESFKNKAKQILKDNKIPVYDPKMGKNAFGFNINEIAGVTGSAKSKAAEFSQFVDVMEGNINTKAMAGFQSKLSTARAAIEKDPTKLSVESKKINKMAKNLEKTYGVELPRLQDPDATKYFSPKRLNELKAQGLDIVKAAERAGYTIQMPKNAMTITEFTDPKNANQLKKDLLKLAGTANKKCKGLLSYGGRVGLAEGLSPEFCINEGKKVARDLVAKNIEGTLAQKSIMKRVTSGVTNFVKSILDPKELFDIKKQLFSKGAIASVPIFDAVMAADDALRKDMDPKEAFAKTLSFGSIPRAMGFTDNIGVINAKKMLENPNLSPAGKEYAQLIIDSGDYEKMQSDTTGGMTKKFTEFKEMQNKIKNASTSGRFDYENALAEMQGTFKAKPKENKFFFDDAPDKPDVTPLTNKFATPAKSRGPMTEKKKQKVDYTPLTYQNYKPFSFTKEEFEDTMRQMGSLKEGQIYNNDFYKETIEAPMKASQFKEFMEVPGFKGTQNNFLSQGLKLPPKQVKKA